MPDCPNFLFCFDTKHRRDPGSPYQRLVILEMAISNILQAIGYTMIRSEMAIEEILSSRLLKYEIEHGASSKDLRRGHTRCAANQCANENNQHSHSLAEAGSF